MKSYQELEDQFNKDVYNLRHTCKHINSEFTHCFIDGINVRCPYCGEDISLRHKDKESFTCTCFNTGKVITLFYHNFVIPEREGMTAREKINYIFVNYLHNVSFNEWNIRSIINEK